MPATTPPDHRNLQCDFGLRMCRHSDSWLGPSSPSSTVRPMGVDLVGCELRGEVVNYASCPYRTVTRWCNGNTRDFGSLIPGSSPGRVAQNLARSQGLGPKRKSRVPFRMWFSPSMDIEGDCESQSAYLYGSATRNHLGRREGYADEIRLAQSVVPGLP